MPITFTVDHEQRTIHAQASAPMAVDDVTSFVTSQATLGLWAYLVLLEEMDGMGWLPTSGEIYTIREHVRILAREHGERGRVAIVVHGGQDALYGMMRMYSIVGALDGRQPFSAFRDIPSAVAWLKGESTG